MESAQGGVLPNVVQGSRFTNNSDSLSASLDLSPRLLNTSSMAFISA